MWFPQKSSPLELWEMPYQHIENTISFLRAFIAGSETARRPMRDWKLHIAFLERELRYREDEYYRILAITVRKNPKDHTVLLAFADRCQELGYYVTERRLRRKVHESSKPRKRAVASR